LTFNHHIRCAGIPDYPEWKFGARFDPAVG
jgi:hypothetical protein